MKLIPYTPGRMPHPWALPDDWLERLGVKREAAVHYTALSEAERRFLDGIVRLQYDYRERDLLAASVHDRKRVSRRLQRRLFKEIDAQWLPQGQGRAITFKRSIPVFDAYRAYERWLASLPHPGTPLLDLILPYWIKDECECVHTGPGYMHVTVTPYHPQIGARGVLQWRTMTLTAMDLMSRPLDPYSKQERNEFAANPWVLLGEHACARVVGWSLTDQKWRAPLGLVSYLSLLWHDVTRGRGRDSGGPWFDFENEPHINAGAHTMEFYVRNPTAAQVQRWLDAIAARHFRHRVPRGLRQLHFDVADDFTKITASCVFKTRSPFGCFYRPQKGPLTERTSADASS